ncbi:TPA: EscJ/YscJ/HrcJ family type III secretion inner membrane ring protein, partial [Shigella sonnei]|nr:EscJ/YscJ/HrcJ family type III secretion inner membrane ring protein [Shigella sonnei]HCR6883039.1 EscJ/YscJ/HrcJ family type III secretion inner membrane ring protein [Shigella sonnei]
ILTPKEEYVYTNVQPVKEIKSEFLTNEVIYLFLGMAVLVVILLVWAFKTGWFKRNKI